MAEGQPRDVEPRLFNAGTRGSVIGHYNKMIEEIDFGRIGQRV